MSRSLKKETELGEIEIHEITFSKMLMSISSSMGGKVFLSSKEGKPLGGIDRKITASEAAKNMIFNYDQEENTVTWTFYVITSFGESIRDISNVFFDYLIENLKAMFPGIKGTLIFKVTGVKSKQIAARNVVVTKEF